MHVFSLYSQIEASRYNQVLQILAGVTASHPIQISEQALVYQQLKLPDVPRDKRTQVKQPTATRPTYHKLVRDLNDWKGYHTDPTPWRLRKEETPEPGVKNVISQKITEKPLNDKELEPFQESSAWYRYGSRSATPKNIDRLQVCESTCHFRLPICEWQRSD